MQFDLALLLPDVSDAEDVRLDRITDRLGDRTGIERVHVASTENGTPDRLCIQYDRSEIDEAALRDVLRSMAESPGDGLQGPDRSADEEQTGGHAHSVQEPGEVGEWRELVASIVAGLCVVVGFGLSFVTGVSGDVSWGLYLGGYVFGGYYTVREAVDSLREGAFDVDLLMIAAATGAAALGRWLEGAFLLFLFSLGHALEHYAMGRARQAIEALADLAPDMALVRRDGEEREVAVDELRVGDAVLVKPSERIPADGIVVEGESAVNQAPVTGESVPVDKRPVDDSDADAPAPEKVEAAHRVFAGTINGSGALTVRVTKAAEDSTLSRVVQMVTEAEAEKAPTERFTDRFERWFVPAVLGLVGVLLFAWVPLGEPMADSVYRALAVLVAASPCALAIATPSAVLSGIARAGQSGVLVKGGGPLERLGRLGAVAFDKTGTLTEGTPRVTEVRPTDGHTDTELVRLAVAVERRSDHPLAEAVVRYGEEHLGNESVPEATAVEHVTGRGLTARVDGAPLAVGNAALFDEIEGPPLSDCLRDTIEGLESKGRTTIVVRHDGEYLGVLGLTDTPRDGAAAVVRQLRTLGIRRLIVLSGDNQRVVDAVGDELGIDEAHGGLLPDDKVEAVRALRREEDVAMVGDGVNDAPAMANATVGIAMGAAGSDAALETADVALMADDLEPLPFAVGLSRQTSRIIRQNLWIALGMVAILVPATLSGLDIGPAVVLHEGSTLLVVGNALRLLGYTP